MISNNGSRLSQCPLQSLLPPERSESTRAQHDRSSLPQIREIYPYLPIRHRSRINSKSGFLGGMCSIRNRFVCSGKASVPRGSQDLSVQLHQHAYPDLRDRSDPTGLPKHFRHPAQSENHWSTEGSRQESTQHVSTDGGLFQKWPHPKLSTNFNNASKNIQYCSKPRYVFFPLIILDIFWWDTQEHRSLGMLCSRLCWRTISCLLKQTNIILGDWFS